MPMTTHPCPSCTAPAAPHESICSACGLVFASAAPAAFSASAAPPFVYTALRPGQSLANGRYTVRRALSKGGMGAIYLAADHEAFDRLVIVKAMLDYFDPADPQALQVARARFLMEARTLSALRHPAIPQIYTYFKDGAHNYIVMEYIAGHDLEQHLTHLDDATGQIIAGQPYARADVIRWGIGLCQVLTYLASCQPQPVVHHDIKPANLIRDASSGDIRLVDFGTARARLLAQPGGIGLQQSSVYGTAGYAAPEQYRGASEPRSDVYALAATLYHLATDDDPRGHAFQFPSLARLGDFGQALRPALDPHVAQRPSARELQRQLERLLVPSAARPLQAPDGAGLVDQAALALWCERHWWDGAAWLYGKLPDQIELWWGQTKLARELRAIVDQQRSHTGAGLDAALALLDPSGFGAEQPQLAIDQASLQYGTLRSGTPGSATVTFTNQGRRFVQADVQPPAWIAARERTITLAPGGSTQITFSAEPWRVKARGRQHDEIILRGAAGLARIATLATFSRWPFNWRPLATIAVAIAVVAELFWIARPPAPIPAQPAIALDSREGIAMLRDQRERALAAARQSGDLVGAIEGASDVLGLAFGDAGRTLLAIGKDAQLRSWSAWDTQPLLSSQATSRDITSLSFSADGRLVAVGSSSGIIYVRSTGDGALLLTLDAFNASVMSLGFSQDGQILTAVSQHGQSTLWRMSDGGLIARSADAAHAISVAAISPDDQVIAALGGYDNQLELRRARDGVALLGGPKAVQARLVTFSPDGRMIAVVNYSGDIFVWDVHTSAEIQLPTNNLSLSSFAFSPSGDVMACGAYDGTITLWRLRNGAATELKTLHGVPATITSLAFSADGNMLVSGDTRGTIMIWKASVKSDT